MFQIANLGSQPLTLNNATFSFGAPLAPTNNKNVGLWWLPPTSQAGYFSASNVPGAATASLWCVLPWCMPSIDCMRAGSRSGAGAMLSLSCCFVSTLVRPSGAPLPR
jgi:hypothetical protein